MNSSRLALPTFFNYSEEKTDNGYETMQDFFLSWIFRCSDEKRRRNSNECDHSLYAF